MGLEFAAVRWLRAKLSAFKLFLTDLVTPFATIARELRRMNDLKTLEMSERINPKTGDREPIIPITELPGKNDTEVFFGEEPEAHGTAKLRKNLTKLWEAETVDDDE